MAESNQAAMSPGVPGSPPPARAACVGAADVSTSSRSGNDNLQSLQSIPAASFRPSDSVDSPGFRDASNTWDPAVGEDSGGNAGDSETKNRLAKVKHILAGTQDTAKEKYRVATDATDNFVHENPWKTIALAAVGGMVVGMLIAR